MNHHEAIKLFTEVSKKYPASVTAQSAALALEAKRNRNIPDLLRNMRHDEHAIDTLARTAGTLHRQSRNKSAPHYVGRVSLEGILDNEMETMNRMIRLRRSQLESIIASYGAYPNEEAYEASVQRTYFPQEPDIYFVKPQ